MRSTFLVVGSIIVAVGLWGCHSGSTAPSSSGSGSTTINILFSSGLGNLGANSFSPNPASVSQGAVVVWHNSDSTTHQIVLNDGSLDSGTIAPNGSSPAKILNASTAQYHCTIHPSMVGSINTATSSSPPPGSGYSRR